MPPLKSVTNHRVTAADINMLMLKILTGDDSCHYLMMMTGKLSEWTRIVRRRRGNPVDQTKQVDGIVGGWVEVWHMI